MRCDYHVHSSISADSSTTALEQIKQAEALGLTRSVSRTFRNLFTEGKNSILTYRIINNDSPLIIPRQKQRN